MKKILLLIVFALVVGNLSAQTQITYSEQIKAKITGALFYDEQLFSQQEKKQLSTDLIRLIEYEKQKNKAGAAELFNQLVSTIDIALGGKIIQTELAAAEKKDINNFYAAECSEVNTLLKNVSADVSVEQKKELISSALQSMDTVNTAIEPRYQEFYQEKIETLKSGEADAKQTELTSYQKQIESLIESDRYEEVGKVYQAAVNVDKRFGQYISYTVKSGDTLSKISARYFKKNITWQILYEQNKAILPDPENPDLIRVGMTLKLPAWGMEQ